MTVSRAGGALLCFLAFSVCGLADVQWLRYRSSANVGEELNVSVSRVYRRFESSRPEGVRCPEFKTDSPLFIKWTTPMDAQGFRWIAMDRSTAHGHYDLL